MDISDSTDSDTKEEAKTTTTRGGLMSTRKPDPRAKLRGKRRPPRGMYMNSETMKAISSGPAGYGDILLKQHEAELVSLKRLVQNNKQLLSSWREKMSAGIGPYRVPEANQKLSGKWVQEELMLAVQGVRRYGKDFRAIAELIGNKNEALIRSFFVTYRRRFKLDDVLAEYEREHGIVSTRETDRDEAMDESPDKSATASGEPTAGAAAPHAALPTEPESAAQTVMPIIASTLPAPTAAPAV